MTRILPVRRLLMDAKALISKPGNWIKGTSAKTAKNKMVGTNSSEACRFCLQGGMERATWNATWPLRKSAFGILGEGLPVGTSFINFNDGWSTTHPLVMRLFNKAIRRAKEQGI